MAAYYSERDSKARFTTLTDGRGYVGLLSVGLPYSWIEDANGLKMKPRRIATLFLGYGTGDKSDTSADESYIGETGSFLGTGAFFGGLQKNVGRGLSNKQYAGLQWTDNTTSIQGWIAKLLGTEDDIVSQSTTVRYHDYRFNEKVRGDRDAGREIDLEFVSEGPKGIKWSVGSSYFMPGRAMEKLFLEDAWSFSAGVSIDPFGK